MLLLKVDPPIQLSFNCCHVPDCPGLNSVSLALGPKVTLRFYPRSFDYTSLARTSCSSPLMAGSLQARLGSELLKQLGEASWVAMMNGSLSVVVLELLSEKFVENGRD